MAYQGLAVSPINNASDAWFVLYLAAFGLCCGRDTDMDVYSISAVRRVLGEDVPCRPAGRSGSRKLHVCLTAKIDGWQVR